MRAINTANMMFLRSRANLRFISLLAVVILLQQFSFASLHHSSFLSYGYRGGLHFSEKQPQKKSESYVGLDVEVAVEEDDDVSHSHERSCATMATLYSVLRQFYSPGSHCHYLDTAEAIPTQNGRPLFMLYHSWKSDLS